MFRPVFVEILIMPVTNAGMQTSRGIGDGLRRPERPARSGYSPQERDKTTRYQGDLIVLRGNTSFLFLRLLLVPGGLIYFLGPG